MENFTDLNINFNVETMTFEVGPPEWQRKASIIADISTIQESLGKGAVSIDQFEVLIKLSIDELGKMVEDQSALLARIKDEDDKADRYF